MTTFYEAFCGNCSAVKELVWILKGLRFWRGLNPLSQMLSHFYISRSVTL